MFFTQFATFSQYAALQPARWVSTVPLLNRRAFGSAGSVFFWGDSGAIEEHAHA